MEKEKKKSKTKSEKSEPSKAAKLGKKMKISTRGRIFEGYVIKKFSDRVVLEFERTVYIPKYERFLKKKTRIHAKLPQNIHVEEGDLVKARECRPLSKIIHFIVVKKIKSAEAEK